MNRKGINYDIGTNFSAEKLSRPIFDRAIVQREIEIIKKDLHCTAIRISGQDQDRLIFASECALDQGLEVWLSPALIDADQPTLLAYLKECAQAAESLRQHLPAIVFVLGCELSLFMDGIIDGKSVYERIDNISKPTYWMKNAFKGGIDRPLNAFLAQAAQAVRAEFQGPLTYASGTWEHVDWAPFDFVAVDQYRDAGNKSHYRQQLRAYFGHGKPVVTTEFGCCPYRGAEDKGGLAWDIVDWAATPRRLKGNYVRDEQVQADTITDLVTIFDEEGVDGAFVFTFVNTMYTYDPRPLYDLDMASYSVVKSFTDHNGTTYPDMPWEPKAAFAALAQSYAAQG